nr:MAG TPA: hypothetical protein [Caudoviricetes sp.]
MRVLEKLFGGFQNSPSGESIFVIFFVFWVNVFKRFIFASLNQV